MNKITRIAKNKATQGRKIASSLRLSGLHKSGRNRNRMLPGEVAGIEHKPDVLTPPEPSSISISYTDYSVTRVETREISNLEDLLSQPFPDWVTVRWINVNSTHPYIINLFRLHFGFHTLTAEDVMHIPQRPRVEIFEDHYFVVLRMLQLTHPGPEQESGDLALAVEQVSLFLYDKILITFQEKPGDVWQPIRDRLQIASSNIRKNNAGYLLYALLDAIVDHCFPVLEKYGDAIEGLELLALEKPSPQILHRIHSLKRELTLLRRIIWPMREVVDQLYRQESGRIQETTKPYLRDVYEHTIQIVEIIESYREMVSGLSDLYMSAVSNKMNEIMKVLTIMASVFIPLTFIAGVYGMNFEFMPELALPWAYPALWGVFVVLTSGMLLYFRRKGWIGNG